MKNLRTVAGPGRLTCMLQAVDRRGNVSWFDYVTTDLPASGVATRRGRARCWREARAGSALRPAGW